MIRVGQDNARLLNITEAEEAELAELAKGYSLENLHRHFDSWLTFQKDLNYSAQPRWLMESQVIRLANLAPLVPVAELTERLLRLLAQNPPPPRPAGYQAPAPAASKISTQPPQPEPAAAQAPKKRPKPDSQTGPMDVDDSDNDDSGPEADSEPSPANQKLTWANFLSEGALDWPTWAKALLNGARAPVFNARRVEVILSPGDKLAAFMEKELYEHFRASLLKIFGEEPDISLERPEDPRLDEKFRSGRLEEIIKSPEAQSLMKILPGRFTEFRPGEVEAGQSAEEKEESENEEPPAEDDNGSEDI